MKRDDKISILVCVHSTDLFHDDLFRGALTSLCNQSFKDFETIVVLDECWEHTEAVANEFVDDLNIKCWGREKKEGLAKAKNFGLTKCTGDWIAFLDADDEYLSCKIEWQRNFLLNNPHIDVLSTLAWDRIGKNIKPSCFVPGQYEFHQQISDRIREENCICHGSVMIRRKALDYVGHYPTTQESLGKEDWQLWYNLLQAGFIFHTLPERMYVWTANTSVAR